MEEEEKFVIRGKYFRALLDVVYTVRSEITRLEEEIKELRRVFDIFQEVEIEDKKISDQIIKGIKN